MTTPAYGVDLGQLLGYAFEPFTFHYAERDASLYALGIGCPSDPLDARELRFVYERSGEGFAVFPTFAVIFASQMIDRMLTGDLPGLRFDPTQLLHGEQFTQLDAPLPTSGAITCRPVISAVYDKGKGALVVADVPCFTDDGARVAFHQYSMYIRGIGGFGGERGTSVEIAAPERPPDAVVAQPTAPTQALLYRLSGDYNPLHADPLIAGLAGFPRPILHGLCTFGFAARAVLRTYGDHDPARFRSIRVRFAKPLFPGETLVTEMWREPERVIFRCLASERGEVVLNSAAVEIA
jgi:3-hydroxyacyl-CoA dehydrogenase/3a,7a,12a-trihydroxy-5b-cholest-24-enoyl-CoA hydratase